MVELAEIFRRHGPEYRSRFGTRILPSHRKAMRDIEQCRTEALGGHVYWCKECEDYLFSYHSCKNRHCPKCQNDETTQWLEKQKNLLLPVPYFLVTFTLPEKLREVARSNQRVVYDILFRSSAASLKKLALDPKYLGARIGMVGVLHTWTRDMAFHPHIHYIVPAGGLSPDGQRWITTQYQDWLVPVAALSKIFRAKFREGMKKAGLFQKVPKKVWEKDWVVHCEPAGTCKEVLNYLAPYVHRIAISNNRIEKLENGQVTFRYKDADTGGWIHRTLEAEEFIRRFLQHVLPKSFVKIRYYGFLSSTQRQPFNQIRILLGVRESASEPTEREEANNEDTQAPLRCPRCGCRLIYLYRLDSRKERAPPC